MIQMVELVGKDIKIAITICYIFKKLKEVLNMFGKVMKDIRKTSKLEF